MECSPGFFVCPAELMQQECRGYMSLMSHRKGIIVHVYETEVELMGLWTEGSVSMREA